MSCAALPLPAQCVPARRHCRRPHQGTRGGFFFGTNTRGERKSERILDGCVQPCGRIHDVNWCRSKYMAGPFKMITPVTVTQTTAIPLRAHVGSTGRLLHTVATLNRMPVAGWNEHGTIVGMMRSPTMLSQMTLSPTTLSPSTLSPSTLSPSTLSPT
jgi:hypothetical protein